jgi:uncharacterized protein YkwD
VGLDRDTSMLTVVVAVQHKELDLEPIPRKLPPGGRAPIKGTLLGRMRKPHLYVTEPKGEVHELAVAVTGDAFRGDFACDRGPGRYQVEVFGTHEMGPTVLANFPVFCGVAPPAARLGPAGYSARSLKAADAEARMLELVNRDRRVAGLPPVAADPALAAVARAHSLDMLQNDFVGHVSPVTGGMEDRLKRAGLAPPRVFENVGRAGSVEEVQAGLMRSPGHRSAILDRQVTHVGIGIVVGEPEPDQITVIATQLYR